MAEILYSLNSFQDFIAQRVTEGTRHILVLGYGRGEFLRELKSKAAAGVRICAADNRPWAKARDGDASLLLDDPLAIDHLKAEAGAYGPFDLILLLDVQDWWHGRVDNIAEIIELLEPQGGLLWVQYLNGLCLDILANRLTSGQTGAASLTLPIHQHPMMDLGSWLGFGHQFGLQQRAFWALANPLVFKYFSQKKAVKIPFAGKELRVNNPTDAINLGAFVHGIEFVHAGTVKDSPGIHLSPMNGLSMQGFLYPDPDGSEAPVRRMHALSEIKALKNGQELSLPAGWADLMKLFETTDDIKDVLLVGAQWGRELMMMRKHYPSLNWSAVETSEELIEMGAKAFPELEDAVQHWKPGTKMPFEDKSFDLVVTFGFCSRNHPQISATLIPEVIRLTRHYVGHFEDAMGAERSLLQKNVPLPEIYLKCGVMAKPQAYSDGRQTTGYYVLAIDLEKEAELDTSEGASENTPDSASDASLEDDSR